MEWRRQDKSGKRSLSGGGGTAEDQRVKHTNNNNNNSSVGTIFNPSPDQTRPRRDPDPIQIPPRPEPVTRYRECQKNHSAHLGTHVVDGCCEFMPDADLGALNCAACGCHRNFHRKQTSNAAAAPTPTPTSNFQISFSNATAMTEFPYGQGPALHHDRRFSDQAAPTMMNFGAWSEDLTNGGSSRKRFRTKFTQEQKEGMMELANKIGWRIHKEDDSHVQQFCAASGVKREVFKVWMHNNKQAIKRKQS